MSILIKNGHIVTAERDYVADVYIEGDKISLIGKKLLLNADNVIDASGKLVIPGGVDVHTHLDMPVGEICTSDDFETGTKAAAFGGTTTIIDFAIQEKGMSLHRAMEIVRNKAEGKACIDYGLHMIITDPSDTFLSEINSMVKEGVTSFKLFMAYPDVLMLNDGLIYKVMTVAKENNALVCMHAENGNVINMIVKKAIADGNTAPIYHALTRPPITEAEAVYRAIALAKIAEVPIYIVHVSCYDALSVIEEEQIKGFPVFAETCPHYLFLTINDLGRENFEGAKFVLTPPLREKWNQEKLWKGLKNNILQVVSTDHCPFNFKKQKELGKSDFTKIPNGGPGIENRLHLLFEGGVNQKRISLNRWIEITSTNPARIFGMYPRKGTIELGSDADIVIWDPNYEHTISAWSHHMRVDYSMYEGFKVKGNAETVILRGKIIIDKYKWVGKAGYGRFIKRDVFKKC